MKQNTNHKTPEFRKSLEENPVNWLKDEIKEMRIETLHSPNWTLEFLDVLGLLIIYPNELKGVAVKELKLQEVQTPILKYDVQDWNAKQAKKNRKAINPDQFREVRDQLIAEKLGITRGGK